MGWDLTLSGALAGPCRPAAASTLAVTTRRLSVTLFDFQTREFFTRGRKVLGGKAISSYRLYSKYSPKLMQNLSPVICQIKFWPNLEGHIWTFSPPTGPNIAQF